MLNKLRLRLTLLYLFSAVVLAVAVGGGSYTLVNYYFRLTNDHALKVKMGLQFAALNIPVPLDLYEAVKQAGLTVVAVPSKSTTSPSLAEGFLEPEESSPDDESNEILQESELADIYVLPIDVQGGLISNIDPQLTTASVNSEAVTAAMKNGFDFRTIKTTQGFLVRLLTYRVPNSDQINVLQVGRYLSTQQQVLGQLMNTMILLGGIITVIFGIASWVLSGRTIRPIQLAWDKQQTFIANASHELRTPLTLIHAGVELGLRKAESTQQREILADVLSDANYMKKLIEELLLLSRLDAHALKLDIQSIKICEFSQEILRQLERLANAQQITLTQKCEEIQVLADPVRLKQILLIVLDNAIRNNKARGSIHVEIAGENGRGLILVSDTGPGIPKEKIEKLFDRFYKLDDYSSTDYRGSGLGLSIAKSLVEAQSGTIQIESSPGAGTRVKLSFPLEP
ncbi:MAG: HAMP domain-containing sensor histidine kinase [Chloroflexi bacterium]|nr:HAMP domain-containing sensor histidine kinase [Chloroflexota bacterium]